MAVNPCGPVKDHFFPMFPDLPLETDHGVIYAGKFLMDQQHRSPFAECFFPSSFSFVGTRLLNGRANRFQLLPGGPQVITDPGFLLGNRSDASRRRPSRL